MSGSTPDYSGSKEEKKKRKKDNTDGGSTPGGEGNRSITNQQKRLGMIAGIIVLVFLIAVALFKNKDKTSAPPPDNAKKERLLDAAQRNPGDAQMFARLNTQVQNQAASIDKLTTALSDQSKDNASLLEEMKLMRGEMTAKDNLFEEVTSLGKEIEGLKARKPLVVPSQNQAGLEEPQDTSSSRGLPVRRGARSLIAPQTSTDNGASRSRRSSGPSQLARREQKVISLKTAGEYNAVEQFAKEVQGGLADAKQPEVFDTKDYVPPNAHAPATVYVGVDAATGKAAQADPQVAAFIITGPAKHVEVNGKVQTTDLKGCIVNGAASGDLSTERVFIKLQKMTCPLEGGRVSVSEVKGHVTSKGKAGVRGTVVSREGDLLTKAMIAGLAQGIGQGASAFSQSGIGIGAGGGLQSNAPDLKDIGIGAVGAGVAQSGQSVSEYVLERAKAYDPVVQMPTGIEVELVFIEGTLLRPTEGVGSK